MEVAAVMTRTSDSAKAATVEVIVGLPLATWHLIVDYPRLTAILLGIVTLVNVVRIAS